MFLWTREVLGGTFTVTKKEPEKSIYWQETWDSLVEIMKKAQVEIPNDPVNVDSPTAIETMSKKLWDLDLDTQRISLAVLTQLCDCIVWWTQRYKGRHSDIDEEER